MANEKDFLSMEDVDAAKDEEYAEIPAWGKMFLAGSLTAEDFIEHQQASEGPASRTAGLRLIIRSMCGKSAACTACSGDGDKHEGMHPRIGTDKHIEMLKKKSIGTTEKLVKAIVKLNGLNVKGESDAKNA